MNIHGGRGRHLQPTNFNKEIFLNLNLPPLHILMQSFIPDIAKELVAQHKKEFYVRHVTPGSLKFDALSAAIDNFRIKKEENVHLPVQSIKATPSSLSKPKTSKS